MKTDPVDHRVKLPIFRRLSTYFPFILIIGLTSPIIIYLAVMQSTGWHVPTFSNTTAAAFLRTSGSQVMLYASPNSSTYFTSIGGNYNTLLAPWRNYFQLRKINYVEIVDIAKLSDQSDGVLVLPSAVSLSDVERARILSFRAKGGAVLTTWATGSRDEKGGWTGWQFLKSVGATMVGETPADTQMRDLILTGESPVSHSQLSGKRIWMSKTSENLLRLKGEMVGARLMDWSRTTDPARRGEGAVIFSEEASNASRTAVFAFAESSWEANPELAYVLIDDTLEWLIRKPVILRAAWPNGKTAAQIIEMDTEEGFDNALLFAAMMQEINYRATFYVLTSTGQTFPGVLRQLHRDFDVGYHGDIHNSFKGQSNQLQEQRLKVMQAEMASVIGDTKGITGFRAPTEGYDATTEQLLQKFGIRHHVVDPARTTGRLPVLANIPNVEIGDALVVIPRTQRDDINLLSTQPTVAELTSALIDDFDLAVDTGALGLLSVHSQNFNKGGTLINAMPGFLEHLKKRRGQLWLASSNQVANWWRDRERFKLASKIIDKRIEFNITITGKEPLKGASLILILPQKGLLPKITPLKIGQPKSTVAKLDDYRASVVFDSLEPGDYAYQATFTP